MTTSTTPSTTRRSGRQSEVRAESLRRLEHEVNVMVRRIRRVLWERARAVHPELQAGSYLMLGYLADHGPVRASTVAEALCLDKGAVSRQLQHLQELGLVDRTPDPDDGRATLVSATDTAVTRMEQVAEDRREFLDERLEDWSEEDLTSFVGALDRYNVALDHA